MRTCEQHDGVMVYEGRHCPVCQLVEEKAELQKQVESMQRQIDDLEERI